VDFSRLMKRYAIHLEDRLVQKSELIVVGSQALKRSYVSRGCSADKLLVLYPTADMNLFRPGPTPVHDEIKRRYGLHGKTVVGFVAGNISASWRRTDLLIDALPVILKKHHHAGVLIVGDGDLKQLSTRLGPDLMKSVAITGKVPYSEVCRYINAMDVCVIPNSTWYGSPTKLFEYGAMRKPVVAPTLPPIQEVVEHGVSGLLFQPCHQADMIRQILLLLENPGRREQLGQSLHERIKSLCTWETNTEAVISAVSRCRR